LLSGALGADSDVGIFDHGGCTSVLNGLYLQPKDAQRPQCLNLRFLTPGAAKTRYL
jgi:hypothetical protein